MAKDVLPETRRPGLLGRRRGSGAASAPVTPANPAAVPSADGETARLRAELTEARRSWAAEREARLALETELKAAPARSVDPSTEVLHTPQELAELADEVRELRERSRHQRADLAAEREARRRVEAELRAAQVAQQRAAALEDDLRVVQRTASADATRIDELVQELTQARLLANRRTSERDELQAQLELARAAQQELAAHAQRASARASAMLADATNQLERLAHLEQELTVLRHQNELLQSQLVEARQHDAIGTQADQPDLLARIDELQHELAESRAELAEVCETRDEAKHHAAKAEHTAERARADREHLLSRLREAEGLAAELEEARLALHALEDVGVQRELGVSAEREELDLLLRQAASRIAELEADRAGTVSAAGAVPTGMTLVSDAELAAHENQVRQLDQRRAEEARRRAEVEALLQQRETELQHAASMHRAALQRHAEVGQRYEQLTRTVLELQKLADVTCSVLGVPPHEPGRLISVVPDLIGRLQDRVGRLQARLEAREADLQRLRDLTVARTAGEARQGQDEPAVTAPAVDSGAGPRADRLLELLRDAAEQVKAG